jgi:hypothetical protein
VPIFDFVKYRQYFPSEFHQYYGIRDQGCTSPFLIVNKVGVAPLLAEQLGFKTNFPGGASTFTRNPRISSNRA